AAGVPKEHIPAAIESLLKRETATAKDGVRTNLEKYAMMAQGRNETLSDTIGRLQAGPTGGFADAGYIAAQNRTANFYAQAADRKDAAGMQHQSQVFDGLIQPQNVDPKTWKALAERNNGATGGWLQSRAWVERGVTFREQMDAARRAAGKP
ncbi:MAG: hypothetical protein KC656_25255, partial [Myxococcales bacterium]|nr:hypothetical protein [Myxococcales bacterium]